MRITLLTILLSCPLVFLSPIPPQSFRDEVVRRHNELRAKHGVGPVKENQEITLYAQKWADQLLERRVLLHSPNNPYGENLAFINSTRPGRDYVDALYIMEENLFRQKGLYGKEPSANDEKEIGHFTQIVWKASTEIGIGKAGIYVVINYKPAGNKRGLYKYNVFPPKA